MTSRNYPTECESNVRLSHYIPLPRAARHNVYIVYDSQRHVYWLTDSIALICIYIIYIHAYGRLPKRISSARRHFRRARVTVPTKNSNRVPTLYIRARWTQCTFHFNVRFIYICMYAHKWHYTFYEWIKDRSGLRNLKNNGFYGTMKPNEIEGICMCHYVRLDT